MIGLMNISEGLKLKYTPLLVYNGNQAVITISRTHKDNDKAKCLRVQISGSTNALHSVK